MPITEHFQAIGPYKLEQLGEFQQIHLSSIKNSDIFLIDCEGMNNLLAESMSLRKAMFALTQISSIHVMVMKEMVNQQNIQNVNSFFGVTRILQGGISNYETGSVILIREVGVNTRSQNIEEKNNLRIEQDRQYKAKIIQEWKKANIGFTIDNLLVLAQPEFDDEELYWKSIENFLKYVENIASSRLKLSGRTLLQFFNKTLPAIQSFNDLDNEKNSF
jgi:protein required for attachment to host cells